MVKLGRWWTNLFVVLFDLDNVRQLVHTEHPQTQYGDHGQ